MQVQSMRGARFLLTLLFFWSGLAALCYQVCWQRLQFLAFGVDMESVTLIVITFMFGLGLGALIGGWIADHSKLPLIVCFALAELAIGLFGLGSPWLIAVAGNIALGSSLWLTVALNFLVLLIPTTLMGATLPVLVKHTILALRSEAWRFGTDRHQGQVGMSTGELYFANTIGAASGAFATAFLLFPYITINQTIFSAAMINISIAAIALVFLPKMKIRKHP